MNLQEFYDYITSQMTAEEALKKLLITNCIHFENLKAVKGKDGSPYFIIAMAAMDLGWSIAVEKNKEEIRGLSVGTKEYLNSIFKEN